MHTNLQTQEPVTAVDQRRATVGVKVLVVVEGTNDIEFLRRISRILNAADAALPDLGRMEAQGHLIFLPVGGSDLGIWSHRLTALGLAEMHLYDRDVPPLTAEHQAAVDAVNRRRGCIAALTSKRHLENYLHTTALYRARGVRVEFGPDDDLAELVARKSYELLGGLHAWKEIPSRKRRQMKHRAKRWLNTDAVDAMTAELLAEQDPQGDIRSWLEAIRWLAEETNSDG